jgi:hypothetical protein
MPQSPAAKSANAKVRFAALSREERDERNARKRELRVAHRVGPPLLPPAVVPYDFIDSDLTDEQLLEGVNPLADVPVTNIPRAALLDALTERMPLAVAFTAWARAVLGVHDASETAWQLDNAIGEIRANEGDVGRRALANRALFNDERRALFQPLIEAGLTLREMAARLELPLALVVRYTWGPRSQPNAEQFANAEEWLIEHGCPPHIRAFAREHGIAHTTVKRICERHGIEYEASRIAAAGTQPTRPFSSRFVTS